MPWVQRIRRHKEPLLYLALFLFLFLVVRLPGLGRDSINPDAVNWHFRTERFINALKSRDWIHTYQHYHPGVTLMWIIGVPIEFVRQIYPEFRYYDKANFLLMHTVAKLSLLLVQLALSFGLIFVLKRLFGFKRALLFVTFLSLEPFFVGNSRLVHLDVLVTLLLFSGLSLGYLSLRALWNSVSPQMDWFAIFSGMSLSLAFLTKSVAIGGLLYMLGAYCLLFVVKKSARRSTLKSLGLFALVYVFTAFVLLPAFWVAPGHVLERIFHESQRVGVRTGHSQIFLGRKTLDPGPLFYPVSALIKTSPLLLFGILLSLALGIKNWISRIRNLLVQRRFSLAFPSFTLFMSVFYLGYSILFLISAKKLDRYLIPLFPVAVLYSVSAYEAFVQACSKLQRLALVLFSVVFLLVLNFAIMPYQFVYMSPLAGSPKYVHSHLISQKPFGIGTAPLRDFLLQTYSTYPYVALYDIKPLARIYPSSLITDIEIGEVRKYDMVILGPDEQMPEKVIREPFEFDERFVLSLGGIEYWRVYVRKDSSFY